MKSSENKMSLSCNFTQKYKDNFLKKHNAVLNEIIFTEEDCPKNATHGYTNFYGVVFENEEEVFVPTFYFNKKGEVLSMRMSEKCAMPTKKAILCNVDSLCSAARDDYGFSQNVRDIYDNLSNEKKKIPKSKKLYIYAIRSVFDKKAVGIVSSYVPAKYKKAIGRTKL